MSGLTHHPERRYDVERERHYPMNRHFEPLVSILIPAYNAQKWIGETIDSALAQTWSRKEIIVVDDGSTDKTLVTARRFESAGVRVVACQHCGAAAARNLAFSLSRGQYIQWLDADDLLAPDKISSQLQFLDSTDSRILLSSAWAHFLHRPYRAQFNPTPLWCDLSPADWLVRKMGQNLYMQTATWLVSRELSDAAGPWDTQLLSDDDQEYFCRVLLASTGVRFVRESKVYYRISGIRRLSYIGQAPRKIEAHWRSIRLHVDYLLSLEDSMRVRAACLKYLQDSLFYFYPERLDLVEECRQLVAALGGQMQIPALCGKYAYLEMLVGRSIAKYAQFLLPEIRYSLVRCWDKAAFALDRCVTPRKCFPCYSDVTRPKARRGSNVGMTPVR